MLLSFVPCFHASANEATNSPAPTTARYFYNAGTELLAKTNFAGAEQMFESALARQDERVQPPALYNLAQARFADGDGRLKQGADTRTTAANGNDALAAGSQAIRALNSALEDTNLDNLVAAYLEGRGARHGLHEAETALQAAMAVYGYTLRQWQGAADSFKSAAELNPADTNAVRNAKIVERDIARLVDKLQAMQRMGAQLGDQAQQLDQAMGKLKGRIPAAAAPPGDDGWDADEAVPPESLAGQREYAPREGDERQIPISPDLAKQILDGIPLDGARQLPMSDQPTAPPGNRAGRNW